MRVCQARWSIITRLLLLLLYQAPEPLDDYQGAVEPALKMYLRKTTSHIVNYIQRAHGLVLGALVVEHVRNLDGKVSLSCVSMLFLHQPSLEVHS